MTHRCSVHQLASIAPRCPRCGGRLFLEEESWNKRRFYDWHCTIGCSRRYPLGLVSTAPVISEPQPVYA